VSRADLTPGAIVEGASLPERIQLVLVEQLGALQKLGGKGLRSGQYHELLLNDAQVAQLKIHPVEEPFDGDPTRFRLGIEAQRLALAYEYDPYFSLSIAKVDPLPHQLEAVYDEILPLPRIRFLLADDPGAGKTIMAGLLLKELKIRGLVQRTLIVAPANLAFQWKRELADKFRERFDILRGVDIRAAYGTNPWQDKSQVITSLDWAKREEVLDSLHRATWDLVIVDEAHKMSASDAEHKTERYRLGEVLSEKADHLLLLTATPHKGDPDNFCLFLQLLDRDVYADVRSLREAMEQNHAPFYLRRVKEALVTFPDPETGIVKKIFTKRSVRTTRFDLDGDEYDFYASLTRYVEDQSIRAAADDSARGRALGFTMAMLQRRFASSLYAVRRSLERLRKKREEWLQKPPAAVAFDERRLEDLDELPEDEAQALLEQIEQAAIPKDRDAIRREIAELTVLIDQARALEAREVESKLAKLREVLVEQKILDGPTKLLIFTEHRDTLEYLAGDGHRDGKLQGWGLTVTRIHGGMPIGEQDKSGTRLYAEQEFRDPDGPRILVATEAAGEGINLHYSCWLMINYDLPWNPVRLEQRMGRIHRYGQEHDCLIFNFVAANTREGRVLDTLLTRLDEIRRALSTPQSEGDEVFDVVGQVVPANQLERLMRDLYAGKTSEEAVKARIVEDYDQEQFARICRSTLEGLATRQLNLSAIIGKAAEARERRLVPEVIEQFFLDATPVAGIRPTRIADGLYRIGRLPRTILAIGESLEPRYGPLLRDYKLIAFDKSVLQGNPAAEWVTPGHPLFETVREELAERVQDDLRRGAVFYDVHRDQPCRLDVYAASIKDGRGRTLHRRLFVMEAGLDGSLHVRQPTLFLDLVAAPQGAAPPEERTSLPERTAVETTLVEEALQPFLAEVSAERIRQIETISRHVEISLNELIHRQNLQLAEFLEVQRVASDTSGLAGNIAQAEARLDELNGRLERRREELEKERHFTIADITHIGRAWVLPHPERANYAPLVRDDEVECTAVAEVMRYEAARGWQPRDVSDEDRGFDILSKHPVSGDVRFIEVKGRANVGEVALTRNEYETAQRLARDYWLYVVFDCATQPRLIRVADPARLGWQPIVTIEHYHVGPDEVLEAQASGEEGMA
jgi:superfamily II DNA or RNA helicase